jgi:glycosyltransferase involved in cell wall biosynthesis
MAVSDKFRPGSSVSGGGYALFVGGAFYANVAGIRWFVNQVAPHICTRVIIVGNGFGALRTELERTGKVQVVGAVDDLSDWYGGAEFVIAPIFDGSGMKTKVAEALMFGKKVVGTPEAFSGYEAVADQAGWTCTTATDFIDVIERLQQEPPMAFDPALRSIYEANFSSAAALKRLQQILCESNSDTVSA